MNARPQPDRPPDRPGATAPRVRRFKEITIKPAHPGATDPRLRPTLSRRRAVLVFGLLVAMRALHRALRACAEAVDTLEGRRRL